MSRSCLGAHRRAPRPVALPGLALLAGLGIAAPGVTAQTAAAAWACGDAPDRVASTQEQWTRLLAGGDPLGADGLEPRVARLVSETFALDAIARGVLGDDLDGLDEYRRGRFDEALARALVRRMVATLGGGRPGPRLTPVDQEAQRRDGLLRIPFILQYPDERPAQSVWVAEGEDGACRVADVRGAAGELIDDLADLVEDRWDDFSFEQMIADLGGYDFVVLADFERTPKGQLPLGWTWRGGDADKNKPYEVVEEQGNSFLRATDSGESVILGYPVRWDLDEYPYASFRVRVRKVPEGGDERYDDLVDSAAGVYFTLNKKFFGQIPESVKYVWSSTLPPGSAVRRDGIGKPWQVVFGSGTEDVGEWRTYVFDVRQAYRDTFGGDPPRKAEGVGVLSDANSLGAEAWADYDDFRALRTAPEDVTSGVFEILPPLGRKNPGT